jgi:hypothetical protein
VRSLDNIGCRLLLCEPFPVDSHMRDRYQIPDRSSSFPLIHGCVSNVEVLIVLVSKMRQETGANEDKFRVVSQ